MPTVSMAAASICCILATETAWGTAFGCGSLEGFGTDYGEPGGAVLGVAADTPSFSLAAALRAFIFTCLIFGRP